MISLTNWVIIDGLGYVLMIIPFMLSIKYSNKQFYLYYSSKSSIVFLYYICIFLFCLWDKTSGDYFHYEEIVKDISTSREYSAHLEIPYVYLIKNTQGCYFLFRFIVWGGALFFFYKLIKKVQLNDTITIWCFLLITLFNFSYSRVSIGLSLIYLGYLLLIDSGKLNKIMGVIMIIASAFLHKSLYVLIFLVIFSLIPLSKFLLYTLVLLFPLIIYSLNNILAYILDNIGLSNNEMRYLNQEKTAYGISQILQTSLILIPVIYNLFLALKQNFQKKKKLPFAYEKLTILSFYILYISTVLSFLDIGHNAISYRIRNMMLLPMSIILSYNLRIFGINWFQFIMLLMLVAYNFYYILYMYYLKSLGLGI